MNKISKIALTYGDPGGVGPEILNYLLATPKFKNLTKQNEFTIFGSAKLINIPKDLALNFTNIPEPSQDGGEHSFCYLQAAIEACLLGNYNGLITGPISKANWAKAGHHWKGQTELLGFMCKANPEMLFVTNGAQPWRSMLLTRHLALREVPASLNFERVKEATQTLKKFLEEYCKICSPKLALAGLNPHAGENGEIGREEKDFWKDWCQELNLKGPYSPDDIWYRAGRAYIEDRPQEFDAYLAPYHDQALPLIKTITNFKAVNVSIGLPFIRTSPDHGTAFNLVGTGKADPEPFFEAIRLCTELIKDPN
jgi:4-hydroxythreonine-4-phosphate dehydrogenase